MVGQPLDPAPTTGRPDRSVQQSEEDVQFVECTPSKKKEMRCGTTHHNHPEPDIVVTVVWIVVVTVSGTGVVLVVVPRAAAQHTSVARLPQAS